MKVQTAHLGKVVAQYRLGATWFDGSLEISIPGGEPGAVLQITGTEAVVALRDFLNSLDFSGRRLSLVKNDPAPGTQAVPGSEEQLSKAC